MELRKREHALERELQDARKENEQLTGKVQQHEARAIAAEQARGEGPWRDARPRGPQLVAHSTLVGPRTRPAVSPA